MNESMNILLSAIAIIFIAIFGIMYFTASMSVLDQGVNATGTGYEHVYNSTRSTTQVSISFFSFVPILLSISILIFGAMLLYKAGRGGVQ